MKTRDFSEIKPKREVLDALDDPENEAWLASYLDVYAHKLAEQQRAWLADPASRAALESEGASALPDLIDPAKENT